MHAKIKDEDEETIAAVPTGGNHNSGKSKRRKCICISITLTLLSIALLILILSLTIFKSKKPITTFNSVAIKDINATVNPPFKLSINISLDLTISVKNPNKVGVTYRNSSAVLRYRGHDIGNVPILGGKIGSGATKHMNLTLTVFADRLLSDLNDVSGDVISGNFPLSTYTKISGKIRVLKMFNIPVSSTSTCNIKIDILSRKIVSQKCDY